MLGYKQAGDAHLLDPHRRGRLFWFQQMDAAPATQPHLHQHPLPHDQVEARIAAAVAVGGHVFSDANHPVVNPR